MSRRSQREVIEKRIKIVRKLEAELSRLWKAKSNLGFIELPKPIRDGWIKRFRIREDILRSKDGEVLLEVLDAIVVEIWGREKKYADRNWIRFFSRNREEFPRPGIKQLGEQEYKLLSLQAKKYFFKRNGVAYNKATYACTIPRHYFVETYKRAYIDKFRIVSPILESRNKEVEQALASPLLRAYSSYYNDHYRYFSNSVKKDRRRVKMELAGHGKGCFE